MFHKFYLLALISVFMIPVKSFSKIFEYKTVDYIDKTELEKNLIILGSEGWELTSCVTSGYTNYTATTRTDVINGLKFARTSYCIFKREK